MDAECDQSPYKKVEILASFLRQCDSIENCVNYDCNNSDKCRVEYCSEDILEEGEICIFTPMSSELVDVSENEN
jgi:hypothetical protein